MLTDSHTDLCRGNAAIEASHSGGSGSARCSETAEGSYGLTKEARRLVWCLRLSENTRLLCREGQRLLRSERREGSAERNGGGRSREEAVGRRDAHWLRALRLPEDGRRRVRGEGAEAGPERGSWGCGGATEEGPLLLLHPERRSLRLLAEESRRRLTGCRRPEQTTRLLRGAAEEVGSLSERLLWLRLAKGSSSDACGSAECCCKYIIQRNGSTSRAILYLVTVTLIRETDGGES